MTRSRSGCWTIVLTLALVGGLACGKYGPPRRSAQATAERAATESQPDALLDESEAQAEASEEFEEAGEQPALGAPEAGETP
jgi:hypothetical protein